MCPHFGGILLSDPPRFAKFSHVGEFKFPLRSPDRGRVVAVVVVVVVARLGVLYINFLSRRFGPACFSTVNFAQRLFRLAYTILCPRVPLSRAIINYS